MFLDRDGTIVVERYYLADPDRVELLPGVAQALKKLAGAGLALVVVTNQSGIARSLYTTTDFEAVQRRIETLLAAEGVWLDGVYYCPHHPAITGPCECRKPGLALFRKAAAELRLDLARSAFVGDRVKDVLPALSFGARGYLVRTGYGSEHEHEAPREIIVVDDLAAAAAEIGTTPARDEAAEESNALDTSRGDR